MSKKLMLFAMCIVMPGFMVGSESGYFDQFKSFGNKVIDTVNKNSSLVTITAGAILGIWGKAYFSKNNQVDYKDLIFKYSCEDDQVTFDDMVGTKDLKELAKNIVNVMKYPEHYTQEEIAKYRSLLLCSPSGTGKTLFAAALRDMINEEMQADGKGKKIQFIDAKKVLDQNPGFTVEYLFWVAQQQASCIIIFDEIDLIGAHKEKNQVTTGLLLTAMDGIDPAKQVFVIGATNRPDQLDMALICNGKYFNCYPIIN